MWRGCNYAGIPIDADHGGGADCNGHDRSDRGRQLITARLDRYLVLVQQQALAKLATTASSETKIVIATKTEALRRELDSAESKIADAERTTGITRLKIDYETPGKQHSGYPSEWERNWDQLVTASAYALDLALLTALYLTIIGLPLLWLWKRAIKLGLLRDRRVAQNKAVPAPPA